MQRDDFTALFEIMSGLPVTIRLLDPPLHEFLPKSDIEFAQVAAALKCDVDKVHARANELEESNPMLGHAARGWAFPIRKFMRCRRARYSRRPLRRKNPPARRCIRKSWCR